MEMILDAGKDVVESLKKIAKAEDKQLDIVALELLSLGIKAYFASKKRQDKSNDDMDVLKNILNKTLVNNEICAEILAVTFNRERSRLGAYDCESAIKLAEQFASKLIEGRETLD